MHVIIYDDAGQIVRNQTWDTSTYTALDQSGAVIETRPVTAIEAGLAQADNQANNAATLRQQAANALSNNQTYLALSPPTNAQVVAQVQALTRQVDALIRLVVNQLDATS